MSTASCCVSAVGVAAEGAMSADDFAKMMPSGVASAAFSDRMLAAQREMAALQAAEKECVKALLCERARNPPFSSH